MSPGSVADRCGVSFPVLGTGRTPLFIEPAPAGAAVRRRGARRQASTAGDGRDARSAGDGRTRVGPSQRTAMTRDAALGPFDPTSSAIWPKGLDPTAAPISTQRQIGLSACRCPDRARPATARRCRAHRPSGSSPTGSPTPSSPDAEGNDESTVVNPLLRERGLRTLLGAPMVATGELVGVVDVGSTSVRRFTEAEVASRQLVADRLVPAAHARQTRAERDAATVLQASLRPARLPTVPGWELAARYVPRADVGWAATGMTCSCCPATGWVWSSVTWWARGCPRRWTANPTGRHRLDVHSAGICSAAVPGEGFVTGGVEAEARQL